MRMLGKLCSSADDHDLQQVQLALVCGPERTGPLSRGTAQSVWPTCFLRARELSLSQQVACNKI
jgi:hypothetical protein